MIVPLGVVSGVAGGTGDSRAVIVAGLAEAFAGALSMGAGEFIAARAEAQVQRTEVQRELDEHSRTSSLIWPVPHLLSFLSSRTTLLPGDIVSTGTPSGVGLADSRFLKSGDLITIRVTGVGELNNPVVGSS